MRYLSVCSGIEAATVAWHGFGWKPEAFSEIEAFPSAVLKHHYPSVKNVGDMTKFKEWNIGSIDLLVGGTPCQSFSVAGLRKGLDDPRGNLMLTYLAIANTYSPKWLVWENVPGVLSSNGGNDFASLLRGMGELGYGFAYRILDAQYFGVAQRRRRVFVVGCLGDWRSAAAVLFERQSMSWHPAPSREKRQVTTTITKECTGVSRTGHNEDGWNLPVSTSRMVAFGEYVDDGTASAMKARDYKDATDLVAQPIPLNSMTFGRANEKTTRQCLGVGEPGDPAPTLSKTHHHAVAQPMVLMDQGGSVMNVMHDGTVGTLRRETHGHEPIVMQPIAFDSTQITSKQNRSNPKEGEPCHPLASRAHPPAIASSMAVRRLTPVECERLQGFPDNYTNIPWGKRQESPDTPRYKALGNSMAVPVMKWIGQRIKIINENIKI